MTIHTAIHESTMSVVIRVKITMVYEVMMSGVLALSTLRVVAAQYAIKIDA
jgi:hypothetical protein